MSERNVYQRFSEACKIIGSQEWVKNMKNGQYSSIPVDDMRAGVREACAKVGLVHVGPYDIEVNRVADTTNKGSNLIRMDGSCKFRYINIDDPTQTIEYDSMGEAMDNGDKCTGKFITNLIKNHYKAAFDIGELGKDDLDQYSNEDFFDRINRNREKEKPVKAPINPGSDILFGKKKETPSIVTEAPKESTESDVAIPVADVPATDITADRPIEDLIASIVKYNRIGKLRPIVQECAKKWGADPSFWSENQIKECYKKCVEGGRN